MAVWGSTTICFLWALCFYGIYAAASEGISKAWISNISKKRYSDRYRIPFQSFFSLCWPVPWQDLFGISLERMSLL
jgi:hypothetical protein